MTANSQDAHDILQETNLRICRNYGTYDEDRPFLPWAKTVATYQVKTWRRKQSRERLVFDSDIFDTIAGQSEAPLEESDRRFAYLDYCMGKLPSLWRQVISMHYEEARPLQEIAREMRRTRNAVSLLLMRGRRALLECIQLAISEEEGGV